MKSVNTLMTVFRSAEAHYTSATRAEDEESGECQPHVDLFSLLEEGIALRSSVMEEQVVAAQQLKERNIPGPESSALMSQQTDETLLEPI